MLLLGRRIPHEHLVAGLAATLRVGALTADAVALEARKAQEADDADTTLPEPEPRRREPTVTFLTVRRLAHLPPDNRPLPSPAPYDQLLGRRTRGTTAASKGEQMP
ncbi:hypothetical protein [Streptomyces bicolor]|uniref:hypothetical protein n=1 Tax=Streptomyces bicolor TaxID=66874 RepID=UPI000A50EBE3|nr:hypothetical protein [Streptomyces bicolor]